MSRQTAVPGHGTAPSIPARRADPKTIAVTVGLLVAALVFILIGYTIGKPAAQQVTVGRTFSGTLAIISGDQKSGCVTPASGGNQICGPFAVVERADLVPGGRVRAAEEWVTSTPGSRYNLLLIYPPQISQ